MMTALEIVDAFDVQTLPKQTLSKASREENCDWCRSVLREHGMAMAAATPARFVVMNHDGGPAKYTCITHVGMMVGWDSLDEEEGQ